MSTWWPWLRRKIADVTRVDERGRAPAGEEQADDDRLQQIDEERPDSGTTRNATYKAPWRSVTAAMFAIAVGVAPRPKP